MQSLFSSPINSMTPTQQAILFFRSLHKKMTLSEELKDYFNLLKKGALEDSNQLNEQTLIEGIRKFTEIANLDPQAREKFYGNKYLGVHYDNGLADLWNAQNPEKSISGIDLDKICPFSWRHDVNEGYQFLLYTGKEPLSVGLDELIKGPTIIDCGMFCQLSIWMGMRYYLGDEKFNQLFGYTPFYLTQVLWDPIKDAEKPFLGNPLYNFFDHKKAQDVFESALALSYIPNHEDYPIKHPGGNAIGQNTLLMNGGYTIFDPMLRKAHGLTREEVGRLLLESYNASQDQFDERKLALYAAQPERVHPHLGGMTFAKLSMEAKKLKNNVIDEATFSRSQQAQSWLQLDFNYTWFKKWVSQAQKARYLNHGIEYVPLTAHQNVEISGTKREKIPAENRTRSFANFEKTTDLQKDLYNIAASFCENVINGQPHFVGLIGEAGIGKTATLVSCYKELIAKGKKVLWLSEVGNAKWVGALQPIQVTKGSSKETDPAQVHDSQEILAHMARYKKALRAVLTQEVDAVFLDDNNLSGNSGKILFEEVYRWYIQYNKGLFITANHNVLREYYGDSVLDNRFHHQPFMDYTSLAYKNMTLRQHLKGDCLRPELDVTLLARSEDDQMRCLLQSKLRRSIGVIVSYETYQKWEDKLEDKELIPVIDREIFSSIWQSVKSNGGYGPAYARLTEVQKTWLKRFQDCNSLGITIKKFESSSHRTIILEITHAVSSTQEKIIEPSCASNLAAIVNYLHDQGDRRLIIVNRGGFPSSELSAKVEKQLSTYGSDRETARTISRLKSLLNLESVELEEKVTARLSMR